MRTVRCCPGWKVYSAVSDGGTSNATETGSDVSRRTSQTRKGWKTGTGSVPLEVVERLAAGCAAPQCLARCRPESGELVDVGRAAVGARLRPADAEQRQSRAPVRRCD